MLTVTCLPSAPGVPGKVLADARHNFLQAAAAEREAEAGWGEKVHASDFTPPHCTPDAPPGKGPFPVPDHSVRLALNQEQLLHNQLVLKEAMTNAGFPNRGIGFSSIHSRDLPLSQSGWEVTSVTIGLKPLFWQTQDSYQRQPGQDRNPDSDWRPLAFYLLNCSLTSS